MTLLGIVALIVLIIAGLMVLRVKSDPMENESVRDYLADAKHADTKSSSSPPQPADSVRPRSTDSRSET
jgi:hypothetical protein